MFDAQGTTTQPMSVDALRLQVAALTVLQDRVKSELDTARAELHRAMRNGEGHTVWSPLRDGEQIATINRSKPKPIARVVDPEAFDEWLAEQHPDAVRVTRHATAEGVEFLADAAPELLEEHREIAEWAREAALKQAAKNREPAPGVEIVAAPEGRLSVRLADNAVELVAELVRGGVIDLRGQPMREIES